MNELILTHPHPSESRTGQDAPAPAHLQAQQRQEHCDRTEGGFSFAHLVVVEVPVDGEPVGAQALQVFGAASLWPSLNLHEGRVAPGPQQLGTIVFLWDGRVISCRNVNTNDTSLTMCAPNMHVYSMITLQNRNLTSFARDWCRWSYINTVSI